MTVTVELATPLTHALSWLSRSRQASCAVAVARDAHSSTFLALSPFPVSLSASLSYEYGSSCPCMLPPATAPISKSVNSLMAISFKLWKRVSSPAIGSGVNNRFRKAAMRKRNALV